jgi:hypothetical protein
MADRQLRLALWGAPSSLMLDCTPWRLYKKNRNSVADVVMSSITTFQTAVFETKSSPSMCTCMGFVPAKEPAKQGKQKLNTPHDLPFKKLSSLLRFRSSWDDQLG